MDKDQLAEVIRRRLKLDDEEWTIVKENPKFQPLFRNAIEASKYQLVAEVIDSKDCHSGHVKGQTLVFDSSGNLLTKEEPGPCLFFYNAQLNCFDQCVF